MVYLLPLYHPLRLIEEVCMLDQLSGGRFQLGVGRGVSMYRDRGLWRSTSPSPGDVSRGVQVLLKGLTSDELSFKGEFYDFDKLPMILKPVQKPHPPLWYGVDAAVQRRLAGREQRQHRRARAPRQPSAIVKAYRDTRAKPASTRTAP